VWNLNWVYIKRLSDWVVGTHLVLGRKGPKTIPLRKVDISHFQNSGNHKALSTYLNQFLMAFLITA
jgi:hypothetical protein